MRIFLATGRPAEGFINSSKEVGMAILLVARRRVGDGRCDKNVL
jgi:hypothetical protein